MKMPNEKKETTSKTKAEKPAYKKKRSEGLRDALQELEMHLEEVKQDILDIVSQRFYQQ